MKSGSLLSRIAKLLFILVAIASSAAAQDSKLVIVGDSLAAGVENNSLVGIQQIHSFANLIARQANMPLVMPLVPYPGAPNTLQLISPQFPQVIQPVPGTLLFPRWNAFQPVTDLAVPYQTVDDALNRRPDNNIFGTDTTQLATDLVLGFPCPVLFSWCNGGSQVEQAIALRPTTVVVELGSNDILELVKSGQFALFTPAQLQTFLTNFNNSYGMLLDLLASTHATLIVGNIPDIMEAPYFMPAAKLAQAEGMDAGLLATQLGIGTNDYVTRDAIPTVEAILTNSQQGPLATACPTTIQPCVVPIQEAITVRVVIAELDILISLQALRHGAALADLFAVVDDISAHGYTVGGVKLTSDFLGGLFSLDGLHPTDTGYAIMANAFIKALNKSSATPVLPADVTKIASCDPLVLHHPSLCLSLDW